MSVLDSMLVQDFPAAHCNPYNPARNRNESVDSLLLLVAEDEETGSAKHLPNQSGLRRRCWGHTCVLRHLP